MKLSNLRKTLLASAAGLALTLGASASAFAAPVPTFTLAPSALGGDSSTQANFTADHIDLTSSELLHTDMSGGHTGSGWAQVNGFDLVSIPLSPLKTGLLMNYDLYLTYTLSDVAGTGTANAAGSTNTLTQLNFQFWADPNMDTQFTAASVNDTTATEATVDGGTGDDILLAYGGLINGVAGFDALGGAFLNSIESFAVCTGAGSATLQGQPVTGPLAAGAAACTSGVGNSFFALPQPFYGLGFDEFNNTTQGLSTSANFPGLVAINQATGSIDFNRIPEPGSLALLGLGMLGAGLNLRRRAKK